MAVDAATGDTPSGVPRSVMYTYATHRLLSDDGLYFKASRKGMFTPRQKHELETLRRHLDERSQAGRCRLTPG